MLTQSGGASTPLSTQQQAALTAYLTAQTAVGGNLYGYQPQGIANVLNAPVTTANPAPSSVVAVASVPKTAVLAVLNQVKNTLVALINVGIAATATTAAVAPNPALTPVLNVVLAIQSDILAWPQDTFGASAVQDYGNNLVALLQQIPGLLPAAAITALTTTTIPPDPASYTVPQAWLLMGQPAWIESADIAALAAAG